MDQRSALQSKTRDLYNVHASGNQQLTKISPINF